MVEEQYISLKDVAEYLGTDPLDIEKYAAQLGIQAQKRNLAGHEDAPLLTITHDEADEIVRHWTNQWFELVSQQSFRGNEEHLAILQQGRKIWNQWRLDYPDIQPDLQGLFSPDADFQDFDFRGANLENAHLYRCGCVNADFSGAQLTSAGFGGATLGNTRFIGATLTQANLMQAHLYRANLSGARLFQALLFGANLEAANLAGLNLTGQSLEATNLKNADLQGSDLSEANLQGANLWDAKLCGANLQGARLVETNVEGADFDQILAYGISVWDLKGTPKSQKGLLITSQDVATITVDDLEVAQFISLLNRREKIPNIIETVTSKAVLILGRFTPPERKATLFAIANELRKHNLLPIIFDFNPSPKRDLTETVQLLANMSKFVIADLTDAKSIPQELSHIIPFLPSVPIKPIILSSQREYAMFEHWEEGFKSVLSQFCYDDENHLIQNFENNVLKSVEAWKEEKAEVSVLKEQIEKEQAEARALREEIEKLKAKITRID
jgi:uncharacterized protein YjbI with pentapeptide repeats